MSGEVIKTLVAITRTELWNVCHAIDGNTGNVITSRIYGSIFCRLGTIGTIFGRCTTSN